MNIQEKLFTDIQSLKSGSIQHIAGFVQNDLHSMIDDGHITIEQIKEAKIEQNKEFDKLIATIESLQLRSNEYFDSLLPVGDLTGEQISSIIMGYYFHEKYNFLRGPYPDSKFVEDHDFYVFITPTSAKNGYITDSKLVLTTLKLESQYRLKSMNVGQYSSTIELESFPGIFFNAMNFEFSPDFHKKDDRIA